MKIVRINLKKRNKSGSKAGRNAIKGLINKADSEIRGYLKFEPGWDGYYGAQFEKETIKRARKLLSQISNYLQKEGLVPDEIVPGPASDGSIDIEIMLHGKSTVFTLSPDSNVMDVSHMGYKQNYMPLSTSDLNLCFSEVFAL